jgi:hypothetical protein
VQLGIKAFIPHQQRGQRIQQLRHSKPCQHHQTCYVLGIRVQNGGSLLQLQTGHTHPHYTRKNGSHSTSVAHHNRQQHSTRSHCWHHEPKGFQSMDQLFHWLKCHSAQHQFLYLWCCCILNHANYTSKHHAPKHHQVVCPFFILDSLLTQLLFPQLINLQVTTTLQHWVGHSCYTSIQNFVTYFMAPLATFKGVKYALVGEWIGGRYSILKARCRS